MRQIGTQSSKCFRKIVTFVLAFAMVITSMAVSSVESQAATKKVSKVTIGVKVGSSGILVLKKGQTKKLNVTVSPKKASKKVTYKSSKKSVVSVSSKGVVKARKSKGSAKITVTSKQNAKKKATIKVKIGTPIKKVSIQNKAVVSWTSANWVLKEVNGQKKKVWPSYKQTVTAKKSTYEVMKGRVITLKTSTSPKKATYKKYYWKSSKSSVASVAAASKVGSSAKISARKKGTATITATAMDGSGKTTKVKIKVVPFESDKTAAPTAEPDQYTGTDVQNFESYEVGTDWTTLPEGGATKGEPYVNNNVGTMKVVQDPENAQNKCLEIDYTNGDTQAYDFAPVFTVDLAKLAGCDDTTKLSKFVGVRFNCRMVANTSDCQYKTIACYFAPAGSIKPEYYFDTSLTESGEYFKFKADASMATGVDKDYAATLFNGVATTENQKVFPSFFSAWTTAGKYGEKSCSPGYKENETDGTVGFAKRTILFNRDRMKSSMDGDMLESKSFDMVFGSTFKGIYAPYGYHLKLYIDDVQLVTADIPVTEIKFKTKPDQMTVGLSSKVELEFVPDNTTQQEVIWTSSNQNVAYVDKEGNISAESAGTTVITVTSKDNPSISNSFTLTVKEPVYAEQEFKVDLDDLTKYKSQKDDKGEEIFIQPTANEDGSITLPFTEKNQFAVYDFGQDLDLTQYQSFSIQGYTAGQLSIEFYTADIDFTFSKADGKEYNWWDESQWTYYPFFEGTASERMNNGRFVTKGEETNQVVWQYGGGKKDLSKIRYMVIKAVQAAAHPVEVTDPDYKYVVNDITFTPEYALNFKDGYVRMSSLNEAVATSSDKLTRIGLTQAEYTGSLKAQAARKGTYRDVNSFNSDLTNAVSFTSKEVSGDFSGMAFYLDFINCDPADRVMKEYLDEDGKVTRIRMTHKVVDLTKYDYNYIKVDVKSDSQLSVKLLNDGNDWASGDTVEIKEEYKASDGCYYVPLSEFKKIDMKAVDAAGIAVHTAGIKTTINSIQFVKDKP